MADLHRGLAHKRSTLTSILDRLVERRLITRKVAELDRRTFLIGLTPKGKKLAQRISHHLSDLERAVVRRVSPGDLEGFKRVVVALEEEAHWRTRAPRR